MIAISRIQSDWTLILAETGERIDIRPGTNMIVPAPSRPGEVPLCLRGLLPTHNHNRNLIDLLNSCPVNAFAGHAVVAAIFAADSFLPFIDIVRAMRRAGIRKVTNFPTVSAYGPLVETALSDVGLGVELEFEILARFRNSAFETAATLREVKHQKAAIEAGNFAVIELARSDKQVFSRLSTQKNAVPTLFMTPDASAPLSGRPPNTDGLVLTRDQFS